MTMHPLSPAASANSTVEQLVSRAAGATALIEPVLAIDPTERLAEGFDLDEPHASGPHAAGTTVRISWKTAIINFLAVTLPFAGLIAAGILLWGSMFHWIDLVLLVTMTLISGLGITVGFHRLCTHKSFDTPAFMRYAFAAAGSMAVQGPVINWCAEHRKHHQHSDADGDPHSPHVHGDITWGRGVWGTLRGAFHAHVGWLFERRSTDLDKYAVDLYRDPALVAANRHFALWVLIGLLLPAAVAGLVTLSWFGALLGFLWGGLARVFLVHHITWSVNSVCHIWGSRPFNSHDHSRNNAIVGILAMGEGWHNNHHAFPASARHGLKWWQFDLSYLVIRSLGLVGLARKIRTPDQQRIDAKMRR